MSDLSYYPDQYVYLDCPHAHSVGLIPGHNINYSSWLKSEEATASFASILVTPLLGCVTPDVPGTGRRRGVELVPVRNTHSKDSTPKMKDALGGGGGVRPH